MGGRRRAVRFGLVAAMTASFLGLVTAPSQAQQSVAPTVDLTVAPSSRPEPGGTFTFTVSIRNNFPGGIIIDEISSSPYGDLLDPGNAQVTQNTCPALDDGQPFDIDTDGTATCSFRGSFTGVSGDDQITTVQVESRSVRGELDPRADRIRIAITDPVDRPDPEPQPPRPGRPAIVTNASPDVDLGGEVFDTAQLINVPSRQGDIVFRLYGPDDDDCSRRPVFTSTVRPGRGPVTTSESFVPRVPGTYQWIATFVPDDDTQITMRGLCSDPSEDVVVRPLRPARSGISVDKRATPPSRPAPGGAFTFIVTVTNESTSNVTLYDLDDTVHGDLDGRGTCDVPQVLSPDESYSCQFVADFFGDAGDNEIDVVIARARTSRNGDDLVARDDAEIFLTRGRDLSTTGGTTTGGTTTSGTTTGGTTTGGTTSGTTTGGTTTSGTTGGTTAGGTTTPATVQPNVIVRTGSENRLTFLWAVLLLSVGGMFLVTGLDLRARKRHA